MPTNDTISKNLSEFFPVRVKELRRMKGLTLTKAAENIGITKSVFAGYENGTKFPSSFNLRKLAISLGTSADYLMGLTSLPVPLPLTFEDIELRWKGERLSEEQLQLLAAIIKTMIEQNSRAYSEMYKHY